MPFRAPVIIIQGQPPATPPAQPPPGVRPAIVVSNRAVVRAYQITKYVRRRHAVRLRAPSVPTTTPLVRKRILLTNEAVDRASRWHGERQRRGITRILRAQLWPHRPPRQTITMNGSDRATQVRYRYKKRRPIILRSRVVFVPVILPSKQPLIGRGGRRAVVVRARQNRGIVLMLRAPSVTTPTPLVRNRVQATANGNRRATMRARFFRQRHNVVLRAVVAFVPPPPFVRNRPTVSANGSHRAVQARYRFKKRRGILLRSLVAPQPTRGRTLVTRRPHRPRRHNPPQLLHGAKYLPPPPRRSQPVIGRPARRRAADARYHRQRHALYRHPPLGSVAPPVTIVTGFFDPPGPGGGVAPGAVGAATLDPGQPVAVGYDSGGPGAGVFDPGSPGQG